MFELVAEFNRRAEQPYNGTVSFNDGDAVVQRMRLITEEYVELTEAVQKATFEDTPENRANVLKETIDLLYVTLGLGVVFFKADVCSNAFDVVHRNNMDKLRDGVVKDENGKVVKPEGWQKVDLREVLADE
jgi:predicted HAD superfamily Cof-like phosphohydrolase